MIFEFILSFITCFFLILVSVIYQTNYENNKTMINKYINIHIMHIMHIMHILHIIHINIIIFFFFFFCIYIYNLSIKFYYIIIQFFRMDGV